MTGGTEIEWFSDRSVAIQTERPMSAVNGLATALAKIEPSLIVRAGLDMILIEAPTPMLQLRDWVMDAWSMAGSEEATQEAKSIVHTIRVRYDGEDIDAVSEALGLTRDTFIAAHCAERWYVAMLGFAPGFGYLLPEQAFPWNTIPRRPSPRASVPAGAVAIAAGMSAVYPRALPGGWNLVGSTSTVFFDPTNEANPTLLRPGDTVLFEAQ